MPVDQDWLEGLPDVEDAASSDWEGAMDQNFMDFTRFGSDDMDSQNLFVDDNDMFSMADDASVAPAGITHPLETDFTNHHASASNSDMYDDTSSKEEISVRSSEITDKHATSEFQGTVSSGVASSSSERPHKSKKNDKKDEDVWDAADRVCHICEGSPTFSDVSHLLTHCSSRAHTKRHFDMKARALTDASAAATLRTYKAWYERKDVGIRINKRLFEKDKKDSHRKRETAKRGSTKPPAKKRKTETKAQSKSTKQEEQEPQPASESSRLPPALPIEPALAFQTFANLPFHLDANPASVASSSHSLQPSTSQTRLSAMADQGYEDLPIPGLESPTGSVFAPSESGFEYAEVADDDDDRKPTLKGKYWPGMDIFDAASEQDRRRRNQRKDASVLVKMQQSSASIQTTMMVLDSNFDHSSDRDVYDEPSCDEGTPSKKPGSAVKRRATPRKTRGVKGKSMSRIKSEPRTPRTARGNNITAPQTSGPRRATRGSAARAQAEIARMAQNELADRFEDAADSDNESIPLPVKASASDTSQDRDGSVRPSTAGISSDGNASVTNNDVFQDSDVGSAEAAMNHALGGHGHARFPRRNRVPLQALSRNGPPIASPNLSSPTPSSKPMPLSFPGKENNSIFKQGMMVSHAGVHGQNMGNQGMMFSNMGMQGMPRSLWAGNMGQGPYGYGYQGAFADPMMFGSGVGAHQPSNMMQPQMNGMYHDDIQHNHMFQPHATVNDGQHWQNNNNDLAGSHASHGLSTLGGNWMGNAPGAPGYDDDQHGGHYQDN